MKRSPIRVEIILILLIMGCILFINSFTTTKMRELENASVNAIFVNQDVPFIDDDAFKEEIYKYRPSFCKLIELYTEDYVLLFSASFDDQYSASDIDIKKYPELISIIESTSEGQTKIKNDKYEENVYFQWFQSSKSEKRLLMVYSSREIVNNIWVFSLVCYITIALVFTLLIYELLGRSRDHLTSYHRVSNHKRNI